MGGGTIILKGWSEIMKLKSNLNSIISSKGLKKKHLADKVNVSPTTFAQWCNNDIKTGYIKAVPSVLNAMVLAKELNCQVEDLFELVDE